MSPLAVDGGIRQLGADLLLEVVGQLLHMGVILKSKCAMRISHALANAGNIRHGLGTGAHAFS